MFWKLKFWCAWENKWFVILLFWICMSAFGFSPFWLLISYWTFFHVVGNSCWICTDDTHAECSLRWQVACYTRGRVCALIIWSSFYHHYFQSVWVLNSIYFFDLRSYMSYIFVCSYNLRSISSSATSVIKVNSSSWKMDISWIDIFIWKLCIARIIGLFKHHYWIHHVWEGHTFKNIHGTLIPWILSYKEIGPVTKCTSISDGSVFFFFGEVNGYCVFLYFCLMMLSYISIFFNIILVIKVLLGENPGCELGDSAPSKSGLVTVLEVLKIQMNFWPSLASRFTELQSLWEIYAAENKSEEPIYELFLIV